jgi:PAS domain S-box-containing protein
MDIRALKTTTTNPAHSAASDDPRTEKRTGDLATSPHSTSQNTSGNYVIQSMDDADGMFMYAPVSLWEEDFSEVKRRLDHLKRSGVEDLRKHFKKNPEEVLALARIVRIVRVNNETLALYEAAGPVEFREGLSPIFNKDSFEVFKEELLAFWKGRTSFSGEAINLTLTGTSKNILIHMIIPPGFEHTWAKVYVAIMDITAIRDSMRNITASEQKYRNLFDTTQTATVIVDATSGMIVEANKSAKRLLGASSGELAGLHLADLVHPEEQKLVRALMGHQDERPSLSGQVLHVCPRNGNKTPVMVTANTIEVNGMTVIALSFAQIDAAAPAKRKGNYPHAGLRKKLSPRECEILRHICSGNTSRAIAQHLSISEKTVRTHRTRIMQKLDMHCVADLVKFSMAAGLSRVA